MSSPPHLHESDAAGGTTNGTTMTEEATMKAAPIGPDRAIDAPAQHPRDARLMAKLKDAQRHLQNGTQLWRDTCAPDDGKGGGGEFMDEDTRSDLLAVALQDLHKALQVQELALGKGDGRCQETRLLVLKCHVRRRSWGRAGLWIFRMMRVSRVPGEVPALLQTYLQTDSSKPLAHAVDLAGVALKEEAIADQAVADEEADTLEFDRAASLYVQVLQKLDQIHDLEELTSAKNGKGKKENSFHGVPGGDEVFYINGVPMTVNGAIAKHGAKHGSRSNGKRNAAAAVLPVDYGEICGKLGHANRTLEKWWDAERAFGRASSWYDDVLGPHHPISSTVAQLRKSAAAQANGLGENADGTPRSVRSGRSGRSGISIKSFLSAFSWKKKNKKKEEDSFLDSTASGRQKKKGFLKRLFTSKKKQVPQKATSSGGKLLLDMSQMEIAVPGK